MLFCEACFNRGNGTWPSHLDGRVSCCCGGGSLRPACRCCNLLMLPSPLCIITTRDVPLFGDLMLGLDSQPLFRRGILQFSTWTGSTPCLIFNRKLTAHLVMAMNIAPAAWQTGKLPSPRAAPIPATADGPVWAFKQHSLSPSNTRKQSSRHPVVYSHPRSRPAAHSLGEGKIPASAVMWCRNCGT